MVQVTFDTTNDSIEELEHALKLLQTAIEKQRGSPAEKVAALQKDQVKEEKEEAEESDDDSLAINIPFLKIKVKETTNEEEEAPAAKVEDKKVPTLNQLLSESITEEELEQMFKENPPQPEKHKETKQEDAYIEIVEYEKE